MFETLQRQGRRPSRAVRHNLQNEKVKVRKVRNHKCKLPVEENQIHEFINDGIFVLLRRRIRQWFTVSPSHLDSIKYLKSTAQIQREKMRHFSSHYYMIHPFSAARFAWEMFMIPVLFSLFIVIPADVAVTNDRTRVYFKIILDIICLVDIILWFFTGYFDAEKHKVELNFSKVVKHYATRLFLLDFISSASPFYSAFSPPEDEKYAWLASLALLKIARLSTLKCYILKLCERLNIRFLNQWIPFVIFMMSLIFIILWGSSFLLLMTTYRLQLRKNEGEVSVEVIANEFTPLLNTMWDALRGFLAIGIGDIQNISKRLMFFELLCLLCGSVLNIILLAKIMQLFQYRSSSKNKYASFLCEVHEYMKYKELPQRVRDKIFSFIDFKFKRHIFREEEIMNTVSSMLKQEILLQTCHTMVQSVDFFKDLSTHVMLRIVTQLKSEIFLPNDVIVSAGTVGNSMYFIYTGTVAVYASTGQEICHLEDGNHFGEISLVINAKRTATVVAVRECEVFKLNRKDFQVALNPFPSLCEKIKQEALKRLEHTIEITRRHREDQAEKDSVISDTESNALNEYFLERDKQDDV